MASKEYGSKFDNRQEVEDAIKELAQKRGMRHRVAASISLVIV